MRMWHLISKLMELQYQLSPCLSYISYMDGWENLYCELTSERVKKGKINIHKHPLFYLHQKRQTFWGFRFDMSKPQDYYWSDHIVRTLHDVKECEEKTVLLCTSATAGHLTGECGFRWASFDAQSNRWDVPSTNKIIAKRTNVSNSHMQKQI